MLTIEPVAWLQIGSALCAFGSAVFAFLAAWFWFQSAATKAPEMTWEGSEALKPWLDQSVGNNRWGAANAGFSASLAGLSAVLAGVAALVT